MPRLVVCPHCQLHALSSESRCPHCRGHLRTANGRLALTAAAALLGLSPMGCEKSAPKPAPPSDSAGVAEPEYGVPDTHPVEPGTPVQPDGQDPDTPAQPDGQDPDTPAKPDGQDPDAPAEPHEDPDFAAEYGVPATDDAPPMAPMYGLPESDTN